MKELKLRFKSGVHKPPMCRLCRHANQETEDFEEGLIYCTFLFGIKRVCEMIDDGYYLFEEYNGTNCTANQPSEEYEIIQGETNVI